MIELIQHQPTTLIENMIATKTLPQDITYPLTFRVTQDLFKIEWAGGLLVIPLTG